MLKTSSDMLFVGYIEGSEMDLTIKATAGVCIEYYFSLDELYEDCGDDAEYSIIYLKNVFIEDIEGNDFYFDELFQN